jgi:hypothetical protein
MQTLGIADVGVCVPYRVSLNANTLWYWCGFSATHRVTYIVNATSRVTSQIMRYNDLHVRDCTAGVLPCSCCCPPLRPCAMRALLPSDTRFHPLSPLLQGCALSNLPKMTSCSLIFGSSVSGYTNITWTTLGMAFPDQTCFVVGNNGARPLNFTVQVFQYHDCECYSAGRCSAFCTWG